MIDNKNKILALITAQNSCDRIINTAKDYAKKLSCELVVLTSQPLKTTAEKRSKDMICLTKLSKKTEVDIKIIYSDSPLTSIISEVLTINPLHIFAGQGSEGSSFLAGLRIAVADTPISIVGKNSIIYTLPFGETLNEDLA